MSLAFLAFRYAVYLLLTFNVFQFFEEAAAGLHVTFPDGIPIEEYVVAYAGVIDALAWVVLLWAFELETAVIDDKHLDGMVWWAFLIVTLLSYAAIAYASYGYWELTKIPESFAAWAGANPCTLVGGDFSVVESLDEYVPLTSENCGTLVGAAQFSDELQLFSTPQNLVDLGVQAWLDVINSILWLIVVAVLALEIELESSRLFGTRLFKAYKASKIILYLGLAVLVVIWLIYGKPLSAWDAFLWLIAFFFIEMNVFSWQEEIAKKRRRGIYARKNQLVSEATSEAGVASVAGANEPPTPDIATPGRDY